MSTTDAQRLAQAEAVSRRWFRRLQALAVTDASDEVFSLTLRYWMASEHNVALQREGAPAPPSSRRS